MTTTKLKRPKNGTKKKPLTKAEQAALKCAAPGYSACPKESGKDSPYMYQLGCRNEACKTANRNYYKAWRSKRAKAEARKNRLKVKTKVAESS